MSLGLCGAHRTGKTTLARVLSARTDRPFVQTRTSEVFRTHNLDPAHPMDFKTRLSIQHQILISYEEIWETVDESFITDRTPIDLMAYTLADIQGATEVNFPELERYMNRCFEVTNKYFDALVVLQPGIELTPGEGKAALNRGYIEHLNSLIVGLCHDERLNCGVMYMKRETTDLEERLRAILGRGFNLQRAKGN